jgi:hypothetical protein
MEVAKDSIDSAGNPTIVAKYKMWKQPLYKWDEFVVNRHKTKKYIDPWSKKIIEEADGNIVVYNSGGMFFKDFNPNITVIEHQPCPVNVPGMQYFDDSVNIENSVDSLIMINPIALKYHHSLSDALSTPGISRAGYKPSLINWLKPSAKIFLSFSDWHFYYDRLKFTVDDFLTLQLLNLENIGISCVYKSVEKSTVEIYFVLSLVPA